MDLLSINNASLRYPLLGDTAKSLRAIIGRVISRRPFPNKRPTYVEALTDIDLSFPEGARVGLIGPNGAGKSSLLRLMAGIYKPSQGEVTRHGTIVTMFDLAYGMDEEADGYENIDIAGAQLGLSTAKIKAISHEIASFSELGEALYRPIKTYSSGMRVRLAFGLVSSLDSDILLVDEIIGVGDSGFLKKASARLSQKAETTKVFVLASHSEAVLKDFCTTGIVMSVGKICFQGHIEDAINYYNNS